MTQELLDEATPEEPPAAASASRRAVLIGAGAAAVAVLGGCATYDQTAPPPEPDGGVAEPPPPAPAGSASATSSGGTGGGPVVNALAQTTDIPVGGGKILDQQRLVITQPQAGTFKAFSAVCTHAGCVVAEVKNGTINCPCHGSAFKVADGSVASGPAGRALKEQAIAVKGTDITKA